MRLIDADAFKAQIVAAVAKNASIPRKAKLLWEIIDKQPTAYDMDKVEEQLSLERSKAIIRLGENKGTAYEFSERCTLDAYEKAIEIVKGIIF